MKIWLAILIGSAASVALLWFTSVPLGVPGEWVWNRVDAEPDSVWNLIGAAVASGLLTFFVLAGWRRFESSPVASIARFEICVWLVSLAALSFAWIWIVQETSPIVNRLGKAAFVLYYPSSSGYYTRARYDQPNPADLLSGYEKLMREGDVLHTGTHPPGLFLVFHGLIAACRSSDWLSAALDATQPPSFQEGCEVIAINSARSRLPRPFTPLDRRVLWLATILSMLAASLTVIPLYGLLRRTIGISNAWVCASLWSAMPAVAMFVPKSDAAFPLIAVTLLWLWLSAWDRRSPFLGLIAGLVTWCGLVCSLAFLPVVLAAGILTLGWAIVQKILPPATGAQDISESCRVEVGAGHLLCIVAAVVGFAVPTIVLWAMAKVNLLAVWLHNYQNHAGFYDQYPRTYWKWLLVNPIELSYAAGWPLVALAILSFAQTISRVCRNLKQAVGQNSVRVVTTIVFVWGLLWLTGKNSGEAARLWIVFLPWLIWMASFSIERTQTIGSGRAVRIGQIVALVFVQFTICSLTVARVSGFHFESG